MEQERTGSKNVCTVDKKFGCRSFIFWEIKILEKNRPGKKIGILNIQEKFYKEKNVVKNCHRKI